ncbi:MAG: sensor hybrid histidine kinase, partial [Caulobacter sp.]|nr:sensor hybrid histidine kinase [Caulobacter sp.]
MSDAPNPVERAPLSAPFGEAMSARWFFENSQDLFAVAVDGRFTIVNAAWTRLTGWSADELLGQPCIDFVHEGSHAEFRRTAREIRDTGATVSRLKVACKGGGWVWLQGHSRLGPNDEMIGVLRDITAEVARKAELATARRTRELLAEAAGVGLWSYEPATGRIEWSSDLLTLTGLTVADMETPDKLFVRVDPAQRDAVRDRFIAASR